MSKRETIAAEPDFELLIATQRASWRLLVSLSITIAALAVTVVVVEWRLLGLSGFPLVISALLGCIATLLAGSEMVERAERCRGLQAMAVAWRATPPGPAGEATRRCLASLMRSIYGAAACPPRPAIAAYGSGASAPGLQRAA